MEKRRPGTPGALRSDAALLLCSAAVRGACGCWNRRELNSLAIVMGVGVDKGEEKNSVEVTVQIVQPSVLKSAGKGSGESPRARRLST